MAKIDPDKPKFITEIDIQTQTLFIRGNLN